LVSEVFANAPGTGRDQGKEWFEIYNASDRPISLDGVVIRKLDGVTKKEAWREILLSEQAVIEPGRYAVVAERADLGLGLCFAFDVFTLGSRIFELRNSGMQTLCIVTQEGEESCAKFGDDEAFPDGKSRYASRLSDKDVERPQNWWIESCQFYDSNYATPGFAAGICSSNPNAMKESVVPCEDLERDTKIIEKEEVPSPIIESFEAKPAEGRMVSVSYKWDAAGQNVHASLYAIPIGRQEHKIVLKDRLSVSASDVRNEFVAIPEFVTQDVNLCLRLRNHRGKQAQLCDKTVMSFSSTNTAVETEILASAKLEQGGILFEWQFPGGLEGNISIFWRDTAGFEPVVSGIWQGENARSAYLWAKKNLSNHGEGIIRFSTSKGELSSQTFRLTAP